MSSRANTSCDAQSSVHSFTYHSRSQRLSTIHGTVSVDERSVQVSRSVRTDGSQHRSLATPGQPEADDCSLQPLFLVSSAPQRWGMAIGHSHFTVPDHFSVAHDWDGVIRSQHSGLQIRPLNLDAIHKESSSGCSGFYHLGVVWTK